MLSAPFHEGNQRPIRVCSRTERGPVIGLGPWGDVRKGCPQLGPPNPLSTFATDPWHKIHATCLTMSTFR